MPDDPDSTAQALLARLNALRPSPINLSQSTPAVSSNTTNTSDQDTASGDLAARFANLSGAGRSKKNGNANADAAERPLNNLEQGQDTSATKHNDEDDRTIHELLADLGPDEAWELEPDDETSARDLLREAQDALKQSREEDSAASEAEHAGGDVAQERNVTETGDKEDTSNQPPQTEDDEADEIVQRLLAEVSLEEQPSDNAQANESQSGPLGKDGEQHEDDTTENGSDGGGDLVELPAAPTDLPSVVPASDETFLPAAPSTLPSSHQSTGLQKFTDEEIDTWCIICNDDATVRCRGCDGDLYCGNCWYEGHKSPEAGYEERTHKAVAFVKPAGEKKKQTKTKPRILVG